MENGGEIGIFISFKRKGNDCFVLFSGHVTIVISWFCTYYRVLADVQYEDRHGLYIGEGIAAMSRAGIFRAKEGVAIEMTNRVYRLPSFNGIYVFE